MILISSYKNMVQALIKHQDNGRVHPEMKIQSVQAENRGRSVVYRTFMALHSKTVLQHSPKQLKKKVLRIALTP